MGPSSLLREEVYPVCSEPLIPPERGGLPSVQWALYPSWKRRLIPTVQWALHPSSDRRFTKCPVSPLSLLRDEVYPVCSEPLIPPERGGLPSVQWALYPSWKRRLIPTVQWALHPSSDRRFTKCPVSPLSLLRDEVYPVCSEPLIPNTAWEMRFTQCAVGPWSLTGPERWGLPSVQPAPHPS